MAFAWAAPGLHDERAFLLLGCAAAFPAMVGSVFLFWRELRANRRDLRDTADLEKTFAELRLADRQEDRYLGEDGG